MKPLKPLATMLAIAACLSSAATAFAQDRPEPLTLSDGQTVVKDRIKGDDGVKYAISAKPGQQLTLKLSTDNRSAYFNVLKDGNVEAVCNGSMTGNVCSVRADTAAEYVIDVYLMRNAARRNEQARFTLTIDQGAGGSTSTAAPAPSAKDAAKAAADDAVAACKSALALKSGENAVFVLPVSHVPAAGGYEVFLNLKGKSWLCTTDSRGNVNRMDKR